MTLVILPQSQQYRLKAVFSAVCQVSPPTSPVHLYRSPGSSHTLSRQEELVPGKDQRKAACAHVHQTSQCIYIQEKEIEVNFSRHELREVHFVSSQLQPQYSNPVFVCCSLSFLNKRMANPHVVSKSG